MRLFPLHPQSCRDLVRFVVPFALIFLATGYAFAQPEMAEMFQKGTEAMAHRDFDTAEAIFKDALARAEAAQNNFNAGQCLDALGNVYLEHGDYRRSIAFKTRAVAALRPFGKRPALGRALMNLGTTYSLTGDFRRSIDTLQESLTVWEALNDQGAYADTLLSLGNACKRGGQFQKGIEAIQQSIQIRERLNVGPQPLSETHGDLGLIFQLPVTLMPSGNLI